jgi:hypothetical protein
VETAGAAKAMVLKRELRSYQSSKAKSRGKAWTFDRRSWQQIEEGRYSRLGEADGTDLEKAIRQTGYESALPMRLGVPESHFNIEVYTSLKGENVPSSHYPYFVKVHISFNDECIYVTDFPSLILLLDRCNERYHQNMPVLFLDFGDATSSYGFPSR